VRKKEALFGRKVSPEKAALEERFLLIIFYL
jgi:hypothetical protein